MTLDYDPVRGLESCGYTEREAAFLYLAGIHSGYFLRRQFLAFLQREDGAIAQRFFHKSERLGHVHAIAYQRQRHIYHLKAKSIYRLLGQPDSQNRRAKGDREIKLRLMQLDYAIEHFGCTLLETEQQKVEFFQEKLSVPLATLPQFGRTEAGHEPDNDQTTTRSSRFFPDRFPITVEEKPDDQPLVTFAYIDEGLRTVSAFTRWLDARINLLRKLFRAEIVYVSDSTHNFDAAEHEFLRRFPPPTSRGVAPDPLPLGVEHLIRYLHLRRKADARSPLFWDEMGILSQGERLYRSAEFNELLSAWRRGHVTESGIRTRFAARPKPPIIRGYVLLHDYPIWSAKYRLTVI
jgi:hypothetical protein